MYNIYQNLNNIISGNNLPNSEIFNLEKNGLIKRISWSQYIITESGNKFLTLIEKQI